MIPLEHLSPGTTALIRTYVRRRRVIQVTRAAANCVAIVLIWLIITSVADRYLPLPKFVRFALELGTIVLVIFVFSHSLKRLWSPIPWRQAAMEIERSSGRFDGSLQTVVSQSLAPAALRGSIALLNVLSTRVDGIARQTRAASIAPLRPVRRPAAVIGGLLAALALLAMRERLRLPALLMRELLPLSDRTAVTAAMLQVLPGNTTRIAGRSLTIIVHATGLGDSIPTLQFHQDDPVFSAATMAARENDFIYKFASIDKPLTYRVRAGDAVSPTYLVKLTATKSAAATNNLPTTAPHSESAAAYLKAIGR